MQAGNRHIRDFPQEPVDIVAAAALHIVIDHDGIDLDDIPQGLLQTVQVVFAVRQPVFQQVTAQRLVFLLDQFAEPDPQPHVLYIFFLAE